MTDAEGSLERGQSVSLDAALPGRALIGMRRSSFETVARGVGTITELRIHLVLCPKIEQRVHPKYSGLDAARLIQGLCTCWRQVAQTPLTSPKGIQAVESESIIRNVTNTGTAVHWLCSDAGQSQTRYGITERVYHS